MAEQPIKIYVKDGLYVPMKFVTESALDRVEKRFERHIYLKEQTCEKCEYFGERPSDVCEGCPNYKGLYRLHKTVEFKGKECLRLPYGDRASVKKIFGDDLKIVDLTPEVPMKRPIKMTVSLKPDQIPAVAKMVKTRSGVLKSPPRSGKTVMAAAAICKLGLKTIILASQQDWLDNFLETFIGSDTQTAMTNAREKRVGMARKFEDFEKLDVALATYQTFLRPKGKKLLKKISSMFSVLVLDEVQFSAALEFSRVLGTFNCKYKYGLSGTPERKDTLEWVTYKLMGSIFYENKVQRLKPRIEIVYPPHVGKLPQSWVYAVNKLEKHPERLKFIAQEAVKDIKAGHTVLIPMQRVPVIKALAEAINRIMDKNVAIAFHGGVSKSKRVKNNRKEIIDKMRQRKFRCMVGTVSLVSTGINIPPASMLYQTTPSSNLPKADQRFSRVLTPYEGKPQPVFKYFADDIDMVRSCMRAEHFGCVWTTFRPQIDPKTKVKLDDYFRNRKTRGPNEYAGGYI